MKELKIIYGIVTWIWNLIKKYGTSRLTDEQWELFVADGKRGRELYRGEGETYDLLYRGMFSAVQDYYIRKKGNG